MKNWKKESRFKDKAEDKLEVRLENAKTRRIVTWIFEILVTLFFAIVVGIMMFQSVTMQESAMEVILLFLKPMEVTMQLFISAV